MASENATPARAWLDASRESGADRADPVRFRVIEALERRAAAHGGEARRLLDARLSELIAEYAALADGSAHGERGKRDASERVRGALGELLDYAGNQARTESANHIRDGDRLSIAPELLDYFRATWARVRTGQQLREALVQVPQNAGPLNSSNLVHRSLSLMRELSPGYLQHFLAYADALSWMEQLNAGLGAGEAATTKETPRAAGAKKGTRGKARQGTTARDNSANPL